MASATREGFSGQCTAGLASRLVRPVGGSPGYVTRCRARTDRRQLCSCDQLPLAPTKFEIDYVPLFGDYTVACGPARRHPGPIMPRPRFAIRRQSGHELTPSRNFVCFAHGDSMDGGPDPIRHGDPLLFEWITGGSARDYVDQPVLVETAGKSGVAGTLKVLRRQGRRIRIESNNPAVAPIEGQSDMRPVARLVSKLDQQDINPLASRIGEQFKSTDVPPLYGEVFNPGNWRSGHVSLEQSRDPVRHAWRSAPTARSTSSTSRPRTSSCGVRNCRPSRRQEGPEILNALETGKSIELWMRRRASDGGLHLLGSGSAAQPRGVGTDVGDLPTADALVGRTSVAPSR